MNSATSIEPQPRAEWSPGSSDPGKPVTNATSDPGKSAFQPWHLFLLLAMGAATAAVVMARDTHPAALLLLSAAVIAAGLTAWAVFNALSGFLGVRGDVYEKPLAESIEQALLREKALVLRALKELEFDRAMGKVSDADFEAINGPLRLRAMALMEDLARAPKRVAGGPGLQTRAVQAGSEDPALHEDAALHGDQTRAACGACGTSNEPDAKFCKSCGGRL